jgi:hypothetical protein
MDERHLAALDQLAKLRSRDLLRHLDLLWVYPD